MKRIRNVMLIAFALVALAGCATVKGTVLGAGVGYIFGDAEMGAQIGATTGMIKDIWD